MGGDGVATPRDEERFVEGLVGLLRSAGFDIVLSDHAVELRPRVSPATDRILHPSSEARDAVRLAPEAHRLLSKGGAPPVHQDLGTLLKMSVPRQHATFRYGAAAQVTGRCADYDYHDEQTWLIVETADGFGAYATSEIWHFEELGQSTGSVTSPRYPRRVTAVGSHPPTRPLYRPVRGRPTGDRELRTMQLLAGWLAERGPDPTLAEAAAAIGRTPQAVLRAAKRLGVVTGDGVLDASALPQLSENVIDVGSGIRLRLAIHALDGLYETWPEAFSGDDVALGLAALRAELDRFLSHLRLNDPHPTPVTRTVMNAVRSNQAFALRLASGEQCTLHDASLVSTSRGWRLRGRAGHHVDVLLASVAAATAK